MTVNFPKDRDEVTLAKDIFDEIVQETESEDFNSLETPDYTKTELPNADEKTRSDASLPNSDERQFRFTKI